MKKTSIIAMLLAAVCATSCFVGGTFAKYTSTVTGSDTAKVAKWAFTGVDLEHGTVEFNLFDTIVDTVDDNTDADVATGVIAPGTKGEFGFSITNESEVNATYAITFTATNASNIPVVITYNTKEYTWDGAAFVDDTDAELAIPATAIAMGATVAPELSWEWAFESGDDATDTALGIAEATITIEASIVFTQVD